MNAYVLENDLQDEYTLFSHTSWKWRIIYPIFKGSKLILEIHPFSTEPGLREEEYLFLVFQVLAAIVCQNVLEFPKSLDTTAALFVTGCLFLCHCVPPTAKRAAFYHDGLEGSFFMSHDVAVDLVPSCLATIVSCNDNRRRFVQSFIIFKSHQKAKDHESFYKVNRREANDPKIAFDSLTYLGNSEFINDPFSHRIDLWLFKKTCEIKAKQWK